ncbi:MAG: uroporphyrinogen decarboxylase family protein [Armatimonadota bacterium]
MSNVQHKIERIRRVLSHQEADRVPVGEAFWSGAVERFQKKWGPDFDAHRHFDLDYILIAPNLDPRIRSFEILAQDGEDIVVKTGFGATIRRSGKAPMPHFDAFSLSRPEEMQDFGFDDPADSRRFFQGGDDQINCVGDTLQRDIPSWDDRLRAYADDFALFGGVCEPYEYLWRIIGTENALYWMAAEPDMLADFVDRIGRFNLDLCEAQIKAGNGRLTGMYIFGDVACRRGMLFGAPRWRELFKPHVKALIDLCHEHGLVVIYHGCGNASDIFEDMVEIGLDCYNPLEAKADLDVVDLKKTYSGKLAFCGNIDVRILERGNPDEIESEVLYKLQAARGGGWIFQSDHSISSFVSPEAYELAINTLRANGDYPLKGK